MPTQSLVYSRREGVDVGLPQPHVPYEIPATQTRKMASMNVREDS
jgi:hypothetical protein